MAEVLVMPKLGLTMQEGILVSWAIEEGQNVELNASICEVETDKMRVSVESPASGVLLRRIEPQEDVPVGQPIAVIGAPGEDVSDLELFDPSRGPATRAETQAEEQPRSPASTPTRTSRRRRDRSPVSPVARKLAEELGVDLSRVTGTGRGGRVSRSDVEEAAGKNLEGTVEKPTKMRRAIASSMSASATVPQFSLERDVVVGPLEERLAATAAGEPEERRPTVPDAIVVALARSLTRHPNFMRSWEGEGYVRHERVNIGVAVAVPEGLLVPVIADADRLSLGDLAATRRALQGKAAGNGLGVGESTGAVFTISNLGAFGVDRFRALVNPPESGILAVGRIVERGHGRVVTLSLSADHRVVDGADGARLLADIAKELEEAGGRLLD